MQSDQEPSRARRWLRRGRVLVLGLVLGLLQLLLFFQAEALDQWSASHVTTIALAALLYLLIPALEGFLTSRQSTHLALGIGTGCLVGGIGFLVAALSISTWFASQPILCSSGAAALACGGLVSLGHALVFAMLLWEGIGGIIGGLMGGGIGSILGERRIPASNQGGSGADYAP